MGIGSSIVGMIGGAIKPVTDMVDNLHTSDEEKQQVKNELRRLENDITSQVLDYEKELLQSKTELVGAEIRGKSWLQRNWRPLLMLAVVAIIVNNYILFPYLSAFGVEEAQMLELPNGLWTLLTTGVGGYVVGRSGEKIAEKLKKKG
jgi:hypothetical protein